MRCPLWIGIHGDRLDYETTRHLREVAPEGIVLFGRNLRSHAQVRALTRELRQLLGDDLYVAIDHEGGRVIRSRDLCTPFPGNRALGEIYRKNRERGRQLTLQAAHWQGWQLAQLGIDVNLAPVVDLAVEPRNLAVGCRGFAETSTGVAELAASHVEGARRGGATSVLKHFPGCGRATQDPHEELPSIDGVPSAEDIYPFSYVLSKNNDCMVMTSHVHFKGVDREFPMTLSPGSVQQWLRDDIGYGGRVLSDDLEMGAMQAYEFEPMLVRCRRGHDVLMFAEDVEMQRAAARLLRSGDGDPTANLAARDQPLLEQRVIQRQNFHNATSPDEGSPHSCALQIAREACFAHDPRKQLNWDGNDPDPCEVVCWIPELSAAQWRGEDLSVLEQAFDGCRNRTIPAEVSPHDQQSLLAEASQARRVYVCLLDSRRTHRYMECVRALLSATVPVVLVLLAEPEDCLLLEPTLQSAGATTVGCFGFREAQQWALLERIHSGVGIPIE